MNLHIIKVFHVNWVQLNDQLWVQHVNMLNLDTRVPSTDPVSQDYTRPNGQLLPALLNRHADPALHW